MSGWKRVLYWSAVIGAAWSGARLPRPWVVHPISISEMLILGVVLGVYLGGVLRLVQWLLSSGSPRPHRVVGKGPGPKPPGT